MVKDRDVGPLAKLAAIGEFIVLFLDPRVRADLYFPGDRRLYWIRLWRFLRTLG